jgi:hypothetical protein
MSKFFKNFFHGFGSALNVWPDSRHEDYYARNHKSEADALRQDWEKVGQDMWHALAKGETYAKEKSKEKQD